MDTTVDVSRALLLDKPWFKPFYVKKTRCLDEAIAVGAVAADNYLLVLEKEAGVLAFDLLQMNYHHVAQGELAGEPWMVTF